MIQKPKYNEQQLVQLIAQGDSQAFRQVFEELAYRLVYFGIRLTDNQNEAEDATSEAFQQLWVNRKKITGYYEMRSYLYTIVRNRCLNYLKRNRLTALISRQIQEQDSGSSQYLDDRIIHAESMVFIYQAIQSLPDHQRHILYSSYVDEISTSSLAKALGKTEGYVRTTRARALTMLRSILREQGLLEVALTMFFVWEKK